jgi:uncharacterized membrane protein YhaH (DUF805 family)/RNA polymerase subunit RPABC4/transcription elongation factor Spt4
MFKNPFSFEGRIRRTEYGLSVIIYVIAVIIINSIIESQRKGENTTFIILIYIPLSWFILAQGAKRCHDYGIIGWWQLFPFMSIWLIFIKGQTFINEYGANPKGLRNQEQDNTEKQNPQNNQITQVSIKCPKCDAMNSKNNKFCNNCGASLTTLVLIPNEQICTNCQLKFSTDDKYCPNCGAKADDGIEFKVDN